MGTGRGTAAGTRGVKGWGGVRDQPFSFTAGFPVGLWGGITCKSEITLGHKIYHITETPKQTQELGNMGKNVAEHGLF